MKKLAATLCIVGTALTLAACDTAGSGNVETAVPYTTDRTASGEPAQAPRSEQVFRQMQTK